VDSDARRGMHGESDDGYLVDGLMDADSHVITQVKLLTANGGEAQGASQASGDRTQARRSGSSRSRLRCERLGPLESEDSTTDDLPGGEHPTNDEVARTGAVRADGRNGVNKVSKLQRFDVLIRFLPLDGSEFECDHLPSDEPHPNQPTTQRAPVKEKPSFAIISAVFVAGGVRLKAAATLQSRATSRSRGWKTDFLVELNTRATCHWIRRSRLPIPGRLGGRCDP